MTTYMTAIITDHPQTQRALARLLGITGKKNGYLEGGGYRLSCIRGRPVELPPAGCSQKKAWRPAPGPLVRKIKTGNRYRTDPAATRQLETLRRMLAGCGRIIVATAPCGEGELLFRHIYGYLGCTIPFSRLWINALTDTAVREALGKLREGEYDEGLFLSAVARERAGYLMEAYAARALHEATGGRYPFPGRLQAVVLAMVCRRYLDRRHFKPEVYYVPVVTLQKDGVLFHVPAREEYAGQSMAGEAYKRLKDHTRACVQAVSVEQVLLSPPLPYDLGALQKEAEERFSMDPAQVRETAMDLYRQGFITWPDTASRYIPRSLLKRIPGLIQSLAAYPALEKPAAVTGSMEPGTACLRGRKTREHHAIIPTGIIPVKLNREEERIYTLIATGMLRAFAPAGRREVWQAVINPGGIPFAIKKAVVTEPGWTALFEPAGQDGENECLPELTAGERLPVLSRSLVGKRKKAPVLFTAGSLIGEMQAAGIGTPGERAWLIHSLMESGYIQSRGQRLVPTPRGLELYQKIKATGAADVETAGGWEKKLLGIEKNPRSYGACMEAMRAYAVRTGEEIADVCAAPHTIQQTPYICPRCRLGKVTFYRRMAGCSYSRCKMTLSRQVCGKRLTIKQLTALFKTGRSTLVRGFKDKQGKTFDAQIVFDSNGNIHFNDAKGKK